MQNTDNILFEDWLNEFADDELADVLRRIVISCKTIAGFIRRAAIDHLYGSTTIINHQLEEVKTLDVVANNQFIMNLKKSKYVSAMISEEDFAVIKTNNESGRFFVTFDPLDGSSNIDVNVNIGSIFGVYLTDGENYLKPGKEMIAAGYALYGSSTMLVLSLGKRVDGFCLNETNGEFVLTSPNIKIPTEADIYSVNEGNYEMWDESLVEMIKYIKSTDAKNKKKPFSQRYIGSMVADVHRTLIYGGLFMYPASSNAPAGPNGPGGKLRYLYEVAPMSFIIEMAGGKSMIDSNTSALDYIPKALHQRTPIFLGSPKSMDYIMQFLK
jgi:fructose-1,6-bisphosphatase I